LLVGGKAYNRIFENGVGGGKGYDPTVSRFT
jgi:hypothetical protein